jgi:hypothetical protein
MSREPGPLAGEVEGDGPQEGEGGEMSRSVKTVVIGFVAVGAARRLAGWGIASAALALSGIQRSLEDAAAPQPRAPGALPPRLGRDRQAAGDLEVIVRLPEESPVG